MIGASLLVAAAVLSGDHVAILSGDPLRVTADHALPGTGVALFAAPDGHLIVPLRDRDATVSLAPGGSSVTWPGRIFPMFFDEFDRLLVVFPRRLVTLEYPERVEIESVPLAGVETVWRSACSSDGRLAAIVPGGGDRRTVVLSETRRDGMTRSIPLPDPAEAVAVSPDGGWVVVGLASGGLVIVSGDGPIWQQEPAAAGKVVALAVSDDGSAISAGLVDGAGSTLVAYRVRPGRAPLLKQRALLAVPGTVQSLAMDGDAVLVAMSDRVLYFSRAGLRSVESIDVPGATSVVLLPDNPRSAVPNWNEATQP